MVLGGRHSPPEGCALRSSPIASIFMKICLVATAALNVASCALDDIGYLPRTGTVRAATLQTMENSAMDRAAPILIRIYKEERTLEVWKQNRAGEFALLKAFPICKFSGTLGPKIAEGDRQAPEGFYEITRRQMNPLSREYLAFNIGFPNVFDRSLKRTGSVLMVHGGCASTGCYAMTHYEMAEIYGLADEAFKGGQDKIQLQAFPFRMTAYNLTLHADNPNVAFWKMLKAGSDAFVEAARPPSIAVCDRHYVFNATARDLDPSTPCPPGVGQDITAADLQSFAWGPGESRISARSRTRLRLATLCRFSRKAHGHCPAVAQVPAAAHHKRSSRANLIHRADS